ncbi:hypothetical protein AUC68_03215 [Methyloceanibacter methanicus]|uniref:Uncharacterized protein n=1 Tax=Methyloceanibacter methanicus TaxID=1774968 RepID=A0A1E3W2V0_9HYPH|nr:hypothetical protein [Methyloceanibacter methanicus]ODS00135.1 hypothetical protein AUC68_03215 [Methyloceanibacter methanicus]
MWRRVGLGLVGGLLFGGLSPLAAHAEETEPAPSGWTVTGGMYGWFPWVEGTTTAIGKDFNIYATPIDLIEHFDAPPAMVNFEARHGKVSFWGDVLYSKFAFGDDFAAEATPIPFLRIGASGQSTTDYSLGVYQFGGFYQVAEIGGKRGDTTLEVGAGARFIQQDFEVKAKIDANAQIRLRRLVNDIERRIQLIENREQRVAALEEFNTLREDLIDNRIIRAGKRNVRRDDRLRKGIKRSQSRVSSLTKQEATLSAQLAQAQAAGRTRVAAALQKELDVVEARSKANAARIRMLRKQLLRTDTRYGRQIARLSGRLQRVENRGQALAALASLERLQVALLQNALNLSGNDYRGQFAIVGTGNMDWVDPTIALRLQHDFGNGHSITAVGDFGGFNIDDGLSTQMVLTYDIDGTFCGFETTTSVGYKALWLSYEEQTPRGEVGMSAWLHGPIVEIALRW